MFNELCLRLGVERLKLVKSILPEVGVNVANCAIGMINEYVSIAENKMEITEFQLNFLKEEMRRFLYHKSVFETLVFSQKMSPAMKS